MTEAEWLTCSDPQQMLGFLGAIPTNRKLRLFACACCRRHADLLTGAHHRRVLAVAERLADGRSTPEELRAEREHLPASDYALWAATQEDPHRAAVEGSRDIAIHAGQSGYGVVGSGAGLDEKLAAVDAAHDAEAASQANLLRDIFRHPHRDVTFHPSWLTATVAALSAQIYEGENFSALPILADALMDAGCDNDDVLNHCRSDCVHVRGCWVIDLLLGRE